MSGGETAPGDPSFMTSVLELSNCPEGGTGGAIFESTEEAAKLPRHSGDGVCYTTSAGSNRTARPAALDRQPADQWI